MDQPEIFDSFLCENQVPSPTKDPRKGTGTVPCGRNILLPKGQLGGGHYKVVLGSTI